MVDQIVFLTIIIVHFLGWNVKLNETFFAIDRE